MENNTELSTNLCSPSGVKNDPHKHVEIPGPLFETAASHETLPVFPNCHPWLRGRLGLLKSNELSSLF